MHPALRVTDHRSSCQYRWPGCVSIADLSMASEWHWCHSAAGLQLLIPYWSIYSKRHACKSWSASSRASVLTMNWDKSCNDKELTYSRYPSLLKHDGRTRDGQTSVNHSMAVNSLPKPMHLVKEKNEGPIYFCAHPYTTVKFLQKACNEVLQGPKCYLASNMRRHVVEELDKKVMKGTLHPRIIATKTMHVELAVAGDIWRFVRCCAHLMESNSFYFSLQLEASSQHAPWWRCTRPQTARNIFIEVPLLLSPLHPLQAFLHRFCSDSHQNKCKGKHHKWEWGPFSQDAWRFVSDTCLMGPHSMDILVVNQIFEKLVWWFCKVWTRGKKVVKLVYEKREPQNKVFWELGSVVHLNPGSIFAQIWFTDSRERWFRS